MKDSNEKSEVHEHTIVPDFFRVSGVGLGVDTQTHLLNTDTKPKNVNFARILFVDVKKFFKEIHHLLGVPVRSAYKN